MDLKELKIVPPEGMEYYIENGEVRFREIKKNLTYNDIAEILFKYNETYYNDAFANIKHAKETLGNYYNANNCTSKKQAQKLLAINKLLNVAKYLNGDWKPDWNSTSEKKYYIFINDNHDVVISDNTVYCYSITYFKTFKLVQQAIEILGEETIKLALSTDW